MSRLIPIETLSPVQLDAASYAVEDAEGAIYIPVIATKNPGTGEGGAFLDSLPTDKTIKVPGVLNAQLRGMLERRGYTTQNEWAEQYGEYVEVFVREAEGRCGPCAGTGTEDTGMAMTACVYCRGSGRRSAAPKPPG